jgi:hypothetical protein
LRVLGFKYGHIKILLISHTHGDHDEATALVAKETGTKLMVMDADVPEGPTPSSVPTATRPTSRSARIRSAKSGSGKKQNPGTPAR